ncbi:hypothetical protein EJB05_33821, partial [Eragrostis curvula]
MKEKVMAYVMIVLFSGTLYEYCTALPAKPLLEYATPMNSTSSDESRIELIFCIKGRCNYGQGWHDCYCCGVPTAESCHSTAQDCRSKCPACNPKCPLPPSDGTHRILKKTGNEIKRACMRLVGGAPVTNRRRRNDLRIKSNPLLRSYLKEKSGWLYGQQRRWRHIVN